MPGFQIRIDASQAKKGAAEFSEAASKIAKDAKKAGTAVDKAFSAKHGLDASKNGIHSLGTSLAGIEGASRKASSALGMVASDAGKLAFQIGVLVAAYKTLNAASGFVKSGIDFNAGWEESKIGIASVLSSVNQIKDSQGTLLTGAEKFGAALGVAGEAMQRIQIMGLETTATTQQLVSGYQQLIGPAAAAGLNMEQTLDFTMQMVQSLGALGIDLNQISAEGRSLLDGSIIPTQDRLATTLGITGEMVKNWKAQGVYAEELFKHLENFKYAGDYVANTWGGLTSNLKDAVSYVSGSTGTGLFDGAKKSMKELMDSMVDIKNQKVGGEIDNIAEAVGRLEDYMGSGLLNVTRSFIDYLEEMNKPENLLVLEDRIKTVWGSAEDLAGKVGQFISFAGDIVGTAIDGWNKLPEPIQTVGLLGAIFGGKAGLAGVTAVLFAVERADNIVKGIEYGLSARTANTMDFDKLEQFISDVEEEQKKAAEEISKLTSNLTAEIKKNTLDQLNATRSGIEQQIAEQKRIYESAKNDLMPGHLMPGSLFGFSVAKADMDEVKNTITSLEENISRVDKKIAAVTAAVVSVTDAISDIDFLSAFPVEPINTAEKALSSLLDPVETFTSKLATARKQFLDMNGQKAELTLELTFEGGVAANPDGNWMQEGLGKGMFGKSTERMKTFAQSVNDEFRELNESLGITSERIEIIPKQTAGVAKKSKSDFSKVESSVKSLNAEIARLTLSGAELEKWKVDEKISELEKTLGKANPEVARLRTLLTKEVDSKIFDDLLKQADPVAAEIANIKKEHEKFVASAKALQRIDPARYESLMTKEAKEHAKALANVNTAEKEHLDFQRETQRIAAQNSGNTAEAMQLEYQSKVDQWEKEGQSREDIAARVNAEMLKNDEQFSFDSQKLWEESTKRIDESMVDMLMNMGKKGENVFEGMANSFKRMLAEMANAALLRPITVSIMGTVGGVLGMGGTSMAYNQATGQIMSAAAGAGGTGGGMNLGGLPVGSMIPESWTSGASGLFGGVTSGINNFGNTLLPSVFAGNFANPAEAALASFSGAPTLFGTLGAAGAGFGLGGLAGKLLFPDKPNISMGSGLGGGLGAAVGTLFGGGIGTLIGGGIGSLFGGGIGSLFGSKKPKKPAVWGGMNLNLGDADAYDNYDFTSTYDRKGYGKSDFEVTEADYYTIASRDRNKAGGETSKAMQDVLKSVADSAIAQAQAVQKALPEEYAKQFKAQLSQHEIVADVGLKGDDISKEGFEKVASDIQEHVNDSLLKSFQGMDFAEYSGKIKIDQSTIEGLGQFTKALTSIDTAVSSTEQLKNPLSDVEQQAKAAVEQMKSWEDSMHSLGVESEYAATLMDDYRVATVDKFMKSIQDTVNPMSQLEQQAKAQVDQINGWVAALKIMSATEAQVAEAEHARVVAQENLLQTFRDATSPMSDLEKQTRTAVDAITQTVAAMRILGNAESDIAEVEAHRVVVQNNLLDAAHRLVTVTPEIVTATDSVNAEFDAFVAAMKIAGGSLSDLARLEADRISAIQAAVDTLHVPFYDNLTVRTETVLGNDTSTLQLEIAQKKELEEAIKTFGKDSAEYLALVSVQNAESVKHQSDLAKQAADEATRAYENAQASAKSFAQAVEQASNALHQADTNVANAKNALLRYFSDAVTSAENAVKAAKDAQEQLRLSLVQALVGAVDAAKSSTQSAVDAWASEAQSAFEQAQSAYANALGEEASGIKNLVDKHKSLAESMRNLRKDMFLDAQTNPAGGMGAYKSAQSEMQSLFALAKGGDVDAAIRFQDISQKFLDASLSTSSSSSEYQEDFYSVNAMLAELEASSQVQSDAQQAQLDALNAQLESMEEQKKTTEQLRIEMEAARLQAERADKEQISFYEKWDLGKIVPGLEGLENEYRTQAEILREADTALNQALLDGLTTQAELDSLKVVDAVAKLSEDYKAAQENLVAQEEKLATALQEKLDAESKWGVLEVKTQLQLLQDALSTAIGEQTTALNAVLAAQEAAARAAEEAARAQAEAARQQAAANAQAEAARKAAEEAAKKKAEADAKYGGKSQAQIIAEKTSGLNSGLYQGQEKAPGGGSWTSSSTLTKMMQDYGSFDEWYRQIGKAEGYATGGLAKPGGMKFFGEQGLEVGDVASPTRIYDAEKTRLMLDNGYDYAKQAHDSMQTLMKMPAVGTDGSRSAVISELREQNAQLKTQNKLLQSLLNESQSTRKNTQGIADSVENMVRGGVRVRQ